VTKFIFCPIRYLGKVGYFFPTLKSPRELTFTFFLDWRGQSIDKTKLFGALFFTAYIPEYRALGIPFRAIPG
jgi:hypothetical protein